MPVHLRVKIWLDDGGKLFGDGLYDLLARVRRLGSLRQAAREIGMSYAQAWNLVRRLEARLGFRLIESHAGGRSGGGSNLSARCDALLSRYAEFRRQCQDYIEARFEEHFGDDFGEYGVVAPGQRIHDRRGDRLDSVQVPADRDRD